MKIVCVSDDFHDEFQNKRRQGTVHSVFRHVFNFKVDNRLYTIGDKTTSIGPCTATLEEVVNFETWGFSQGDQVNLESQKIVICFGGSKIKFEYEPDKIWPCRFDPDFDQLDPVHIESNLKSLLSVITQWGDPDGIRPLIELMQPHFIWLEDTEITFDQINSARVEWIAEPVVRFLRAIEENLWDEVASATRGIIGFGPGLTPSSDDFVVGLMSGLLHSDRNDQDLLNKFGKWIQGLEGRTTDISYEALRHAASGRVNDLLRKAALAVVSSGNIKDMEKLLRIGQTSGTDLMVGLYFGIAINKYKGEH